MDKAVKTRTKTVLTTHSYLHLSKTASPPSAMNVRLPIAHKMISKYRKPTRGRAAMSDRPIAFDALRIHCTLFPLVHRTLFRIDENAGRAVSSDGASHDIR